MLTTAYAPVFRFFFVQCLLFLILSACTAATTAPAHSITCHTAYRSAPTVPIEAEQTISFGTADQQQEVPYEDLTFHAQYSSGAADNERALRLWISGTGHTAELHSTLFQLPIDSGPQNQFAGGHGFTGLHYAYHPDTAAELQYWCTAGS